jgi:hypothetical protein
MKKDVRSELIGQIEKIRWGVGARILGGESTDYTSELADFILDRETAILSEIEKPLKDFKTEYLAFAPEEYPQHVKRIIDEALSIIQRRKGGK